MTQSGSYHSAKWLSLGGWRGAERVLITVFLFFFVTEWEVGVATQGCLLAIFTPCSMKHVFLDLTPTVQSTCVVSSFCLRTEDWLYPFDNLRSRLFNSMWTVCLPGLSLSSANTLKIGLFPTLQSPWQPCSASPEQEGTGIDAVVPLLMQGLQSFKALKSVSCSCKAACFAGLFPILYPLPAILPLGTLSTSVHSQWILYFKSPRERLDIPIHPVPSALLPQSWLGLLPWVIRKLDVLPLSLFPNMQPDSGLSLGAKDSNIKGHKTPNTRWH